MENKKIQDLLDNFDREEDELLGMMVFNMKTGEVLASTYSDEHSKKVVEIEQTAENLEEHGLSKLDPKRNSTWSVISLEKKIVAFCVIKRNIYLSAEYATQKSPTSVIEDILEVSLLVSHYI